MTTSRSKDLFVYLQRPDNAEWITVGRYRQNGAIGEFLYAPSYLDARHKWSIDPVNLPLIAGEVFYARRYEGLFDVLRDAAPDAWGQMLLRRSKGLPERATALDYLVNAGNGDRWGALAIGNSPKPHIANLSSPRLLRLDEVVAELDAIVASRPPVNASLRKQLFATPSMGGARPKAVVRDGEDFWLVKPGLYTDTVDLALLEHATQQWGRRAGMDFAETRHHPLQGGRSVVLVKRFDRRGEQRSMTLSAASLLQLQYPFVSADDTAGASYPRLAEELKRIGAPTEDRLELFRRMVFNAVLGNDDDHPRNHAVVFRHQEKRWRLAPAFDVVPNPDEDPQRLVMITGAGRRDIDRDALVADHVQFGIPTREAAVHEVSAMVQRMRATFDDIAPLLDPGLRALLTRRLAVWTE
jgi:serine/threonine-protein kinase HipA